MVVQELKARDKKIAEFTNSVDPDEVALNN